MNVENPSSSRGVYLAGHGVIQAGQTAKVRDSKALKQHLKLGTLREVKAEQSEKSTTKEATDESS